MRLHWSPRSPFVRKVMIVLHETGQTDRVECICTVVASSLPPSAEILADNPLGKIPVLVLDDGTSLFDSRVICEYLGGPALLPTEGKSRWQQLRWQALGDGLTDILLLLRNEYLRASPDPALLSAMRTKVDAVFAKLNEEARDLAAAEFGLGHIAIICAIGQLDLRFSQCGWRQAFPALAAVHAQLAARPSVIATAVIDDAPPGPKDTHFLIDFLQDR